MWIPEIYCPDNVNMPYFVINGCDKARFRLKCSVCNVRHGACLQCAYGRCITSAHPSCALNRKSGYSHRIIKNPDNPGTLDWDIFCVQHSTSVKDTLKKKCNSKRAQIVDSSNNEGLADDFVENGFDTNRRMKGGKAMRKQSRTSEDDPADEGIVDGKDSPRKLGRPRGRPPKSSHKDGSSAAASTNGGTEGGARARVRSSGRVRHRRRSRSDYSDEDNGDDDSDDSENEDGSKVYRAGTTEESNRVMASLHQAGDPTRPATFPVYLMLDWPGQAIGEAMDLEHFWNVASMLYPEDHSKEVCKYLSSLCVSSYSWGP